MIVSFESSDSHYGGWHQKSCPRQGVGLSLDGGRTFGADLRNAQSICGKAASGAPLGQPLNTILRSLTRLNTMHVVSGVHDVKNFYKAEIMISIKRSPSFRDCMHPFRLQEGR